MSESLEIADCCLFFGTFNPVHFGHLIMAEAARVQFGFRQVIFIPSYLPPHRHNEDEMISFKHRYRMVQLAYQDNPWFRLSDIESHLATPSYTLETLKAMVSDFDSTNKHIPLIIGSDALKELGTWHKAEILIEKALFLEAPRETAPANTTINLHGKELSINTKHLHVPYIGISSTIIRKRIREKLSIRYFTPQQVVDYITWNRLYL